jgi:hypothetical protein
MNNCPEFAMEIEGEISESLENMRRFADTFGMKFSGGDRSGTFRGKGVEGEYEISGNRIIVKVTRKPKLMPCSFIEKQMRRSVRG